MPRSQESLRTLAKRYGFNQKMVAKRYKRLSVSDYLMGRKTPHSTVLASEEKAIITPLFADISYCPRMTVYLRCRQLFHI
jgi:hypothetical protein